MSDVGSKKLLAAVGLIGAASTAAALLEAHVSLGFLYFPFSYGKIDYTGKRVVDVGAFNGDSAQFFLDRGAVSVVAFEVDPSLLAEMQARFAGDTRVTVMAAWDGQPVRGDVLKMDCEGCEANLTLATLQAYPEYVIGLHPDALGAQKTAELKQIIAATGGSYWGQEFWVSGEALYGKKNP